MYITGLGTAVPPNRYSQEECWRALEGSDAFMRLTAQARGLARKVLLADNGIGSRHLALDPLSQAFEMTPDALHARFTNWAPRLASEAGRRALASAECSAAECDALLVSTCTGYLCPGLTGYVAERLGLPDNLLALDLVGQGCGAALPNLRTAEALLAGGRARRVLCVCVEVCSAAFYLDNDPGVLISACLFGDAAAAAVVSSEPVQGRPRVSWKNCGSILSPADRDYLRFEQKNGMLRNILTRPVPRLAAKHAEQVLRANLEDARANADSVSRWILHAGGREVLRAMERRLELNESNLQWSYEVLRQFGNISSPSVLFVLDSALKDSPPDGLWWMSSFGAGFSCHGALLEVSSPSTARSGGAAERGA